MEPAKVRDAARLLARGAAHRQARAGTTDETIVETEGGHAFVDPFPGVVVLANELRRGPGLQAGQVVATGSFSGFFPVQANQRITAEFDGVGQATAMLVP